MPRQRKMRGEATFPSPIGRFKLQERSNSKSPRPWTPEAPPIKFGVALSDMKKGWSRAYVKAVKIYFDSLVNRGEPYPGWEKFERTLAFDYARLILLLDFPSEKLQNRLLKMFVDSLALGKSLGRPRKCTQLRCIHHALAMKSMWKFDRLIQERWNLAQSLRKQGKSVRDELVKRSVPSNEIKALTVPNVTAESWLAYSYASRSRINPRTARNAIRSYEKVLSCKIISS
jgi:hypothetical protein